MSFSIKGLKKKVIPQFTTPDYCICTSDQHILKFHYKTSTFEHLCTLPPKNNDIKGRLKHGLGRSFLYRRFVSNLFGINHVVELPSGTILALYDRLYRIFKNASGHYQVEVIGGVEGYTSPLNYCMEVNPITGNVFFGEYECTSIRPINILGIFNDGSEVRVCHTFAEGEIRHVHSITWDQYRNRLWITSGDDDDQSGFFYTDDEFKTVNKLYGGAQTWRAVSVFPRKESILWGMDAGKDRGAEDINYLYKVTGDEGESPEKLYEIGNPAYYKCGSEQDNCFLAITYEPGRKQPTPEEASLLYVSSDDKVEEVLSLPYQASKYQGCSRYSAFYMPKGIGPDNRVLVTPMHTAIHNFTLLDIKKG